MLDAGYLQKVIYFIQSPDFTELLVYLAEQSGCNNILSIVTSREVPGIQKMSILNWSELETVAKSDDIFAEGGADQKFLIDIGDLNVSLFPENLGVDSMVYLYSSTQEKLLADSKKMLVKRGVEVIELKKSTESARKSLAIEHITQQKYSIEAKIVDIIVQKSNSQIQVIDMLDLVYLAGDDAKKIIAVEFEAPSLPIYMMQFSLSDASRSAAQWFNTLNSKDDVQLGLSILLGKVTKTSDTKARMATQYIVETDYWMKTQSIDALVAFRVLLWKLKNVARVETRL